MDLRTLSVENKTSNRVTQDPTSRRDVLRYSGLLGATLVGASGTATAASPEGNNETSGDGILSYQPPAPARVISHTEVADVSAGLFDKTRTTTIEADSAQKIQTDSKPPVQTFQTWIKPRTNSVVSTFQFLDQQETNAGYQVTLDVGSDVVELTEINRNSETTRLTDSDLTGELSPREWHRVNVGIEKGRIVLRVYASNETLLTESDIQTDIKPGQLANTTVTLESNSGETEFGAVVSNELSMQVEQEMNKHGELINRDQSAFLSETEGVIATIECEFEFDDGTQQEWAGRVLEDRSMWLEFEDDIYMTIVTDRQREQTQRQLDEVSALRSAGEDQ